MTISMTVRLVLVSIAVALLEPAIAWAQCPTAAVGAPGVPTWRLSLNTIRVQRQRESGGDRPYFASLVFRSCLAGRGTSRVDVVEREPHDWVSKPELRGGVHLRRGDHMSSGETLAIPDWMGRFEWGGMPLVGVTGGLPSQPPWIYGVVIISFDNNNTPPHEIRSIMLRLRENLLGVLRTQVETANVLVSPNWGGLQTAMMKGLGTLGDIYHLTVGSTFNPDKPTGIQFLAWFGTDSPLPIVASPPPSQTLRFPTGDGVILGQQLSNPTPMPMSLSFQGSGASYSVAARLERVGGEHVSWRRINARPGAVSIAACDNGRVYALHADGSLFSTDGIRASIAWQRHGRLPNATHIACAGTTLYFLARSHELFELRAPEGTAAGAPRRLGRPFAAAQLGAAFNGSFPMPWVLNNDSSLWNNPETGLDNRWVRVGRPASAAHIAAVPGRVFALNRDRTLWISETGRDGSWRRIDRPGAAAQIAATAHDEGEPATLYALNDDGSLWRGSVEQ